MKKEINHNFLDLFLKISKNNMEEEKKIKSE